MLKTLALSILLMTLGCLALKAQPLRVKKYFPFPEKIRYDGSALYIGGKETFIYSAAFHYFRTPKALWRDRFAKIKAAGFNTVETYVPWNLCELNMP
ncbi:MAG TPA: beta-galactosidase, partial [Mucilaginibacter sp.]